MSRIELLRKIVSEWQCQKIIVDGQKVTVDANTASLIVKIYDALNEVNKAKFIGMPWPKMVSVAWTLAR